MQVKRFFVAALAVAFGLGVIAAHFFDALFGPAPSLAIGIVVVMGTVIGTVAGLQAGLLVRWWKRGAVPRS